MASVWDKWGDHCPICNTVSQRFFAGIIPGATGYQCPRCGQYAVWDTAYNYVSVLTQHQRSVFSHRIRRMQTDPPRVADIVTNEIPQLQLDQQLPRFHELADNFILWIGNRQGSSLSEQIPLDITAAAAWIGLSLEERPGKFFAWLLNERGFSPLIDHDAVLNGASREILICGIRLTLAGWAKFDAIRAHRVAGKIGFMAMQFGDRDLNWIFENYFKKAVERAGFELRMLTDGQPAGLIDDQLRVALHQAKFVIADLTHSNNGAYWEAGYAEGLGRPVIYSCRREEWEADKRKTHFDTNHHLTVIWDTSNPIDVENRLAATIRATFPDEAKLSDD